MIGSYLLKKSSCRLVVVVDVEEDDDDDVAGVFSVFVVFARLAIDDFTSVLASTFFFFCFDNIFCSLRLNRRFFRVSDGVSCGCASKIKLG